VGRWLLIAAFVVFAQLQLAPLAALAGCSTPCAEDSAEGDCPPVCASCLACAHGSVRPLARSHAAPAPILEAEPLARIAADPAPRSVAPRDIFHVPKSLA
jgi:hypothetical protein